MFRVIKSAKSTVRSSSSTASVSNIRQCVLVKTHLLLQFPPTSRYVFPFISKYPSQYKYKTH